MSPRDVAARRARAVRDAWEHHPGPYVTRTRGGEVIITEVIERTGLGPSYLDVTVGGDPVGGDPRFRVVSPPLLVEDPAGDVERNGRRWRRDPLAALAEVLGMHGGARRGGRR